MTRQKTTTRRNPLQKTSPSQLAKCPTGIRGLDEITYGGLPRGRPTLVCGGAGSGKTLLAMQFVIRGARDMGEPGVFVSFEETEEELAANVRSLGFDVPSLIDQSLLFLDYVYVERSEIQESGEYDLEGLFVRLGYAIDAVKARRMAIDGLEALFSALPNEATLRAELRRLFRWLKEREITLVLTSEQGTQTLSRHGLEEYVSDCVIFLDHRVTDQVATRRLRVVKYRGSMHGTNEYPTLIDEGGLSVLPISSLGLDYEVSVERIPTGVEGLDDMLGGKGYYAGSSILVSGTAGTGKSSLMAAFADAACRRGQTCLYLAFEESPAQIIRNMRSIGFDLQPWVDEKKLHLRAARSTVQGLEQHLVSIHSLVEELKPSAVIIDPVTNLMAIGNPAEVSAMLTRALDYLKIQGITALLTNLTEGGSAPERTVVGISSLMDTWIVLEMDDGREKRRRSLYVLKSRGMAHAGDRRAFSLTDRGIVFESADPFEPSSS